MFLREKVISRVEEDVVLRVGEPGGSLGRLHLAHLGGGDLDNQKVHYVQCTLYRVFFDWSALKMTLRKFLYLELFRWDLLSDTITI